MSWRNRERCGETIVGRADSGHTFYYPETTSQFVYVLLEGRVNQYRINLDGKKIITTTLQPQAFFDATSLIDDGMHHNFAEAVDQVLVLALQHQEFKRLALAYPQMLLYMLAETQGRLVEVEEKLESVAFKGLVGRIAELLLKLAEQQGSNRIVGYTHQEIAEILGTYRETTTQVLNDLRALGYIAIGRKHIDILNAGCLAAAL
jgi:CRP/FNR family cyclic AMP-dependent transcriptional regulator